MVVIRWTVLLLLLLAGCESPCLDEEGSTYTCTCTRTCQGLTEPFTYQSACVTGIPTPIALSRCESSCDPTATCTECSCIRSNECTIEHACR